MKRIASEHSSYETGATYYKDGDKLLREVWGTSYEVDPKTKLTHLVFYYNQAAKLPMHSELDWQRHGQQRRVIEAIASEFRFDISKALLQE